MFYLKYENWHAVDECRSGNEYNMKAVIVSMYAQIYNICVYNKCVPAFKDFMLIMIVV